MWPIKRKEKPKRKRDEILRRRQRRVLIISFAVLLLIVGSCGLWFWSIASVPCTRIDPMDCEFYGFRPRRPTRPVIPTLESTRLTRTPRVTPNPNYVGPTYTPDLVE